MRSLARRLGLGEVAELPASPCLSSRIETGIAIDPTTLALVHGAEQLVGATLNPATVRCRVRASGVVIELDTETLENLTAVARENLQARIRNLFAAQRQDRLVAFEPYRVGSAFLHFKPRD